MNLNDNPLTKDEFDYIYSKVPRLTVELIVKDKQNKVLLSKRAIEPCMGKWHLPGGTVRFAEPLVKTVERIAKRELDINVSKVKNVGFIEYPSHYENGLDSPVGLVFEIVSYTGALKINDEALESSWFSKTPSEMHEDQDLFLINNHYLTN